MGIFIKSASTSVDIAAIAQKCDQGCRISCGQIGSFCTGEMRHNLVSSTHFLRIANTDIGRVSFGRQALSGKMER